MRKPLIVHKNMPQIEPAAFLFRKCKTVDEKLEILAECFRDAKTWRLEESNLMFAFDRRLKKLEEKNEQSGNP